MGLFHQNFDKPGPGVSADAPRKKGAARFFEILGRDFSTIWMAGLLALISSLPFALLLWLAVSTHSLIPLLAAGILGGMIAAPQIVGLNDTILRSLRDEPGFWWATYRRAWKRNVKASLLPGAVCGLLLAMEIFTAFHLDISQSVVPAVAVLVALILLAGIAQYIYAQVALVEVSFGGLLKNAADAVFGLPAPQCAGRSVAGHLLGSGGAVLACQQLCGDPVQPVAALPFELDGDLPRAG